jgi:YceI-like domain
MPFGGKFVFILFLMLIRIILLLSLFINSPVPKVHAQDFMWKAEHGKAQIKSEAPLELIKAESNALKGLIDPATKAFAFTLRINTFEGFNSEIQQVHFFENYMEQKKYPQATFSGKIIEDISFSIPGTYSVRAKGNLEIHGVTRERIIRGTLTIKKGSAHVESSFLIPVSDHGIGIPRIVKQKISEEIAVTLDIDFAEVIKL